jgi:hypothetical protein
MTNQRMKQVTLITVALLFTTIVRYIFFDIVIVS